jgi:tRNA(fMet)-specific endonuclease VapC
MLSLDTCIVVDLLRGRKPHYGRRMQEVTDAGRQIVLSSVVLHELSYGAMIAARPEAQLGMLETIVERAHVEPWTPEDAISAARVRADLRATGSSIAIVDSLIAGQALNRGWQLVTSNIKDFIRVPGLTVVDWSDPAASRQIDRDSALTHLMRRFKEEK